jgi:phage terminase large subunit-like protein
MQHTIRTPSWGEIARDKQRIPEEDWFLWMILAGRGFGKTRTGSETLMNLVNTGNYKRIAIIGKTIKEARDIMVEGQSGILSTTISEKLARNKEEGVDDPSLLKFRYFPSKKQIAWENGARAYILSADNYNSLRGYQFDIVWIDEFAKYKNPEALWQEVLFTLRLGDNPKCIMTTTPRGLKILKKLTENTDTHLTYGSTFENSHNLSARFIETMKADYMETRIGRQEIYGEILMDKENTVWKRESIIYRQIDKGCLSHVVIGVDPAMSAGENSDETGIIVAGKGYDDNIYILDDLSGKYKPPEWAKIVCKAYKDYDAGRVVAETNNGGDLVREMLTAIYKYVPFKPVRAIRGKVSRAEPIALLYESRRVFHTREFFELERQMCELSYEEGTMSTSPDRVDALVWAVKELKDREGGCHVEVL